jgi:hypothetical protein
MGQLGNLVPPKSMFMLSDHMVPPKYMFMLSDHISTTGKSWLEQAV